MTRLLAVALLVALATVIAAGPAGAQETADPPAPPAAESPAPGDSPAGAPSSPGGGGIDLLGLLRPILDDLVTVVFDRVLVGMLQGLAGGLRSAVGALLASSLNFLTRTPPDLSYAQPRVADLAAAMRAVGNAALALVLLWGGLNVMAREHLGVPYHAAMELLPRAATGALLVNSSGWWTRLVVDANNALCAAVGGASLPVWDRVDTSSSVLLDLAATLVYLVACLVLALQMLMRLALVDVLLVTAPLGLACWVLPQTQGWARLWSSTFTAAVFTQFLQVLALRLGGELLAQVAPAPADATAVTPFLGVAALLLAMKVPSLVRVQVSSAVGASPGGGAARAARAAGARGGR